jgi:hypothetical protein
MSPAGAEVYQPVFEDSYAPDTADESDAADESDSADKGTYQSAEDDAAAGSP